MVRSNMIYYWTVTLQDVKNAKVIFGPDATSLKGKSGSCNPASVLTDYVEIPWEILESLKELEVNTYIMFINKLLFLVSISRELKFTMIEYISNISECSLLNYINRIVRHYKSHGILASTMFLEPKFQLL